MQTRAQLRKCIAGIGCIGDIKQRSGYIRKVDEGKRGKGSKSTKPESTRKSTTECTTALYAGYIPRPRYPHQIKSPTDTATRVSYVKHACIYGRFRQLPPRFQHNARSPMMAHQRILRLPFQKRCCIFRYSLIFSYPPRYYETTPR